MGFGAHVYKDGSGVAILKEWTDVSIVRDDLGYSPTYIESISSDNWVTDGLSLSREVALNESEALNNHLLMMGYTVDRFMPFVTPSEIPGCLSLCDNIIHIYDTLGKSLLGKSSCVFYGVSLLNISSAEDIDIESFIKDIDDFADNYYQDNYV